MKTAPTLLSLCLLASLASATQQVEDRVFYEGETYEFGLNGFFPLESYFPTSSPYLNTKWRDILRSRNQSDGLEVVASTGCYRGHVAEWSIVSNRLYLTRIRLGFLDGPFEAVDVLEPIFGGWIDSGTIHAYWFDGHISIEPLRRVLRFSCGVLTDVEDFDSTNAMYVKDRLLRIEERDKRSNRKAARSQEIPAPFGLHPNRRPPASSAAVQTPQADAPVFGP
jgi:hypothetical protein